MGAGRTELMKALDGALPRTSGYVTLTGIRKRYPFTAGWPGKRHCAHPRRP
ncbi:hypothetical protein ACLK1T_12145 [Escherichia coli]